ncbi:alpha/beta hydrolase [Bradyrhizobium sp. 180]|uniref:alpha/beta fold hydrolase n=1 Tax=unclassified Bradyrhizobium TaxID=2631580 RepID=UPI001FF8AE1F|nr:MULTISPECIES: alpha/beta hydrolase [unclassified Bradyrhizobium]MCK1423941.1 alpha/beta hydrolase [Bradyrhizobium sp. CW12]MCK1494765.1 alpha/beta hydrolase [Bradyrhizobium sp. 180]MCK1526890.1 alpha/beta hydrolase [Bradyrhizobium sp. 182]MCK1598372.1 alpha/beta hydrolase [Bradyrhizobium sp. 164]MCK1620769.1 alpha/beta hydrolase [Bradyrhizobium sp. 159]
MSTTETVLLIVLAGLVVLILANIAFQVAAERNNPPIGVFTDCDGVYLHHIERGDAAAPCVVLFHGNGTMVQDLVLSGLVDRLAQNYRVVCFDRPGFGYSHRPRTRIWTATTQAALFAKALDQLGVRNPVVLGHSWGTLVAIALALRSGYAVSGLVLVSGYYFPTARPDFWLMSVPALPLLGDLMRYTISPIISCAIMPKLMRTVFAPRAIPPEFKNEFPISLALRPKQLRAAAEESAFLIPAAAQLRLQYRDIRCPVRIVHGKADRLIEADQSRRLHAVLPRSLLHLVEDAGHMVTYADAAGIADAVAALAPTAPVRTA